MEIRRLLPSDAQAYRTLMLQAYERHPDAFTSSVSERLLEPVEWWSSRLATSEQADEIVLGAFAAEQLVGVSGIAFSKRIKTSHKARIFGMYVERDARGSGIAGKLLTAALDQARSRKGVSVVQLTVTESNEAAQRLYTHIGGFSEYGTEPYAVKIEDSYVSKVHMWRTL